MQAAEPGPGEARRGGGRRLGARQGGRRRQPAAGPRSRCRASRWWRPWSAGQLVPGFLGALPEAQVRQWLGQLMQVAQQLGMPSAADAGGDQAGEAEPARTRRAGRMAGAGVPGPGAGRGAGGHGTRRPRRCGRRLRADARGRSRSPVAAQGLAQVNLFRAELLVRRGEYDRGQQPRQWTRRAARRPRPGQRPGRRPRPALDGPADSDEDFDRLIGTVIGLGDDLPPEDPGRKPLVDPLRPCFPTRATRAVGQARRRLASALF